MLCPFFAFNKMHFIVVVAYIRKICKHFSKNKTRTFVHIPSSFYLLIYLYIESSQSLILETWQLKWGVNIIIRDVEVGGAYNVCTILKRMSNNIVYILFIYVYTHFRYLYICI